MNCFRATSMLAAILVLGGCGNGATRPVADAPLAGPTTREAKVTPSINYSAESARLINDPDQIVSVLNNGMVVITKRVTSPAVSVRGNVMAGGIYEGRWLGGGLSHLLEHLVAGGSCDRRSEAENRNLLQQIGNNSNAGTYPDHTSYYVNTTADNLDAAVDLVTGWMLGARITPEEYAREYEVVQRELEKDKGEPDWVFYDQIQANRYRVSPARVPTIGYQAVIQGLSRDDVYNYYKMAYQPNNMVFAIAGNLAPEVMLKAVQKYVADAPPGRAFSHDIADEPPITSPRTLVSLFPKLGQAKLELAFPSIRLSHPDLFALDLLANILGRGESSILVQELRDRQGLVSGIGASDYTPEYAPGSFAIDMELPADKMPQAMAAVFSILETVKKDGVSEDRLARAKTQIKTGRAFGQQASESVADSMGSDFMSTGDPNFSDRYVQNIDKVTAAEVRAMAEKYLDRSKLLTTAMVPEEAVGEAGLAAAEKLVRTGVPSTQKAHADQAADDITKVELGDGVTLLVKRVNTAPIVVMSLYSLGGLTAEDAQTNGLGYLTMQLVQRGTKSRSAMQIAEFFDSIGGDLNTACGNNSWNWSATCLKEDLEKTLPVFADVVKNPSFPEGELPAIRRRVLAGIEAQDADWYGQSMRLFRKSYFGPRKSPYQFLAIGTAPNVSKFNTDQLRQWYAEKVLKSKRVLTVFGDIDVAQAKKLAEAQFGRDTQQGFGISLNGGSIQISAGGGTLSCVPSVVIRQVEIQKTSNPQAGVIIGFDSESVIGDPVNDPLTVADTMASGFTYPTGYLFESLRGEGLVYDVQAYMMPGRSAEFPGTFIVYAGCDPKNVNKVVDGILLNIARLQGTPADMQPDWFERSKRLIVTSDALENETAGSQATTAALDELFGLGYAYHATFADRIRRVDISGVQAVARARLGRCVVTINTSDPDAVTIKQGKRTYSTFPAVDLTPRGIQHDSGQASH